MTAPAEEEFSELVDADFPRVDAVGKGANGIPRFLIAKADGGGLLDAGFVRDLIAKAEPDSAPAGDEGQVTMTGSPAAIAALIHGAPIRRSPVTKADLSTADLNDLPDSAFAYIEPGGTKDDSGKTTPRSLRHFAIQDKAHADNAAARIAQGAKFGDEAKAKVEAAQRKFGETVSKETVSKDMDPDDTTADLLDPTVPLADPDPDVPGDPTDPGSPAWEAVDAATACKWTSILARAQVAIGLLGERELLESASADPDDVTNAWDMDDVCSAIQFAISVLAPYAVAEQSASDSFAAAMEMVGKAMAGFDEPSLERVEVLGVVRKAGRVLSAANEAAIRTAAASLQTVLTSLPSAPMTDDPVSKEAAVAADQPPASPADAPAQVPSAAPIAKAVMDLGALVYDSQHHPLGTVAPERIGQEIAKAGDKTPQVAVYNQAGALVGIVDPAEITPIQGASPPADDPAAADDPADDSTPAAAPAAESAPAADPDMTPEPPGDAGTPAGATPPDDDEVTKSTEPGTTETTPDTTALAGVLKSIVADAVTAALEGRTPAEDIVSKADVAGLATQLAEAMARIAKVEESPAAPKVFTNGAVPPAHLLRGQDRPGGPAHVDVAKAAELRTAFRNADPAEQNRLANEMQTAAIGHLAAVQGRSQ